MPTLSICIPTFNRKRFLAPLLEVLQGECAGREGVQICISDNASDDGTDALIREWIDRGLAIDYHRAEKNLGADLNYLQVAAMAKGEWIWFLGSDDLPVAGAVAEAWRCLRAVDPQVGIVLWNRSRMDIDGNDQGSDDWFPGYPDGTVVGPALHSWRRYLSTAPSLGCVFSYLSSIMVRADRWRAACPPAPGFIGGAYVHAALLFTIIARGSSLMIRRERIVRCRLGNDSFLAAGLYRRYMLDFDGYERIGYACVEKELQRPLWSILWRYFERPGEQLQLGPCRDWLPRLARWRRMGLGQAGIEEAWRTCLELELNLVKHHLKHWLLKCFRRR